MGLMVSRGDTPIVGGWLYTTDSWYGVAAWFLRNPELRGEGTDEEWDALLTSMKRVAYNVGIRFIFMSIHHPKLIERVQLNDFKRTGVNFTHFICNVGGD